MAGLDPAIHVDARNRSGHDDWLNETYRNVSIVNLFGELARDRERLKARLVKQVRE